MPPNPDVDKSKLATDEHLNHLARMVNFHRLADDSSLRGHTPISVRLEVLNAIWNELRYWRERAGLLEPIGSTPAPANKEP